MHMCPIRTLVKDFLGDVSSKPSGVILAIQWEMELQHSNSYIKEVHMYYELVMWLVAFSRII